MANANMPDFPGFIWVLLLVIFAGFVFLFWRIINNTQIAADVLRESMQTLKTSILQLTESLKTLPLIYRTKEEAVKDWKELVKTLTEIQVKLENLGKNQETGVAQLWNKLNRTVESFFFLAKIIIDRQQALENKLYCDDKEALARSKKDAETLMAQFESMKLEQANHHEKT